MSNCVINHARDKSRVYREVHRILNDNGRFVISDAVTRYPLPESVKAEKYGDHIKFVKILRQANKDFANTSYS